MHSLSNEIARVWAVHKAFFRTFLSKDNTFEGSAEEICREILDKLWNGDFYRVGLGHFNFFWARDFGTVTTSLIALGYGERVRATLSWAIEHYIRAGRISLCITPLGIGFDLPFPAIDALPWFVRSLRAADMPLSEEIRTFIETELYSYCAYFLDDEGMPKKNGNYAELRDTVKYHQSAYAVTMLASLVRDLKEYSFPIPPVLKRDYVAILKMNYWNGSYFDADIGVHAWSSDANIFPFWLGIIDDASMLHSMLNTIQVKKLAQPYPIIFSDEPHAFHTRWWGRLNVPNYQGTTVWTWLGAMYLQLLKSAHRPEYENESKRFATLIEEHKNFPELLNKDGSWYHSLTYRGEEGMIWCANYLALGERVISKTNPIS